MHQTQFFDTEGFPKSGHIFSLSRLQCLLFSGLVVALKVKKLLRNGAWTTQSIWPSMCHKQSVRAATKLAPIEWTKSAVHPSMYRVTMWSDPFSDHSFYFAEQPGLRVVLGGTGFVEQPSIPACKLYINVGHLEIISCPNNCMQSKLAILNRYKLTSNTFLPLYAVCRHVASSFSHRMKSLM